MKTPNITVDTSGFVLHCLGCGSTVYIGTSKGPVGDVASWLASFKFEHEDCFQNAKAQP